MHCVSDWTDSSYWALKLCWGWMTCSLDFTRFETLMEGGPPGANGDDGT